MQTLGESISRVRNSLKVVKEDPFITDRSIASLIFKYARTIIKRQDNENKIMKFHSLFEPIPCIELIEVDKVSACCAGITGGCKIYRTKDRLPKLFEGSFGPLFRNVTSLDASIQIHRTQPGTYTSMTKTTTFKYNKTKYYWYLDGYLYFPNIEWEGVVVEGLWEGDISMWKCEKEKQCLTAQEQPLRVPDYLMSEIEQLVRNEILGGGQIPTDGADNQQNIFR